MVVECHAEVSEASASLRSRPRILHLTSVSKGNRSEAVLGLNSESQHVESMFYRNTVINTKERECNLQW